MLELTNLLYIVSIFLVYYLLVLIINKRMITNPSEIVSKFFMSVLLYVGISLVYFAFTGKPLLESDFKTLQIYIFISGFVAILIAFPNMLKDFDLFKKLIFTRRREDKGHNKRFERRR